MQFSGRTWRPPHERWTPIVEATSGCAWGRCAFCDLFCEERFSISPLDRFCADLDEIKASVPYARRLWLTGGDPFQMGFSRLEERALSVRDRLIKMQTIAMFASVRDIPRYTDAQLARLASLRIGGLVVGMESADDETLSLANKGYTSGEVKSQLLRLERAGISYNVIYMTGLAGKGRGRVAARNTLDVLNGLRPDIVGITSLTLMPKTPLAVLGESGGFLPMPERERLDELAELVAGIGFKTFLDARSASNLVPVAGMLPYDRGRILTEIQHALDIKDEEALAQERTRIRTL